MPYYHGVEVIELASGSRPIRTVASSVIGLIGTAPDADAGAFPLNTPVMVTGRTEAANLGNTGTLSAAVDGIFDQTGAVVVVVRVDEGADETETLANVVGGVDAGTEERTGVHAFIDAQIELNLVPRILIAPGWTHQRPGASANPVVAELQGLAERFRAVIFADCPNTTDADAITYKNDWGSGLIRVLDPWVKVLSGETVVEEPLSARAAGLRAKVDNEKGFWWSDSNQVINGIIGTARPIDYIPGDSSSRANYLNENNITTVIRLDGYRLWGGRTTSADPVWSFLSVRRTAHIIEDSIQRGHLWAIDRPITKTYVEDVAEGVNAYLRSLEAQGAILGGECVPNNELNTSENIEAGKVYFDFDFRPPTDAEHITFRASINDSYFERITS
ncbi:phage tail sheath C-terminal domain-containing protein [Emcibacter sp.]|uniref:phage tail sheath C-terminal domain-containing protein n=1 Tax=Emcibacter sp. TaxID=1979954 RepID=UPI002AA91547|nr:phage tail sheath C-terminal domain-containing protein [Emcibacter sp.]